MTQGWTGRKCPHCKGTGQEYYQERDNDGPCPACGGTGEEYGELDDNAIKIEEPPA